MIACGVLQVIDQHLHAGRVRQLRGMADDLATWAASYETSTPLPAHRQLERAAPARTCSAARCRCRAATRSCRARSSTATSASGSCERSPTWPPMTATRA